MRWFEDTGEHPDSRLPDANLDEPQSERRLVPTPDRVWPTQDDTVLLQTEIGTLFQQLDIRPDTDQKVMAPLQNGGPERITDEARIAAKQRFLGEFSRIQHLDNVCSLAGIGWSQSPHPW